MIDPRELASVSLLAGVQGEDLARVAVLCEPVSFAPGRRIASEGGLAEHLFFVLEGEVELRFDLPLRESSPAATLIKVRPGKTFGWSSLVEPRRYTLTSYSGQEGCRLVRVRGEELLALLEAEPALGYRVMANLARVVAKRFYALQEELARREGQVLLLKS